MPAAREHGAGELVAAGDQTLPLVRCAPSVEVPAQPSFVDEAFGPWHD